MPGDEYVSVGSPNAASIRLSEAVDSDIRRFDPSRPKPSLRIKSEELRSINKVSHGRGGIVPEEFERGIVNVRIAQLDDEVIVGSRLIARRAGPAAVACSVDRRLR